MTKTLISLKVPETCLERAEVLAAELLVEAERIGVRAPTRHSILVLALERGLDALEKQRRKP